MSRLVTLMYHEVSDIPESEIQHIYNTQKSFCIDRDKFDRQIKNLIDSGYNILLPNHLGINRDKINNKSILLTFDDGFVGNVRFVLPVLLKYNLKAIFFIIADRIGTHPYMQWEDVQLLLSAGMEIGSHGFSHNLILGNRSLLIKELFDSKTKIERHIGKRIFSLSFPHGAYNNITIDYAMKAKYQNIFTSDYGFNYRKKGNILLIPRIQILRGMSSKDIDAQISPDRSTYFLEMTKYMFKKLIKKMIGFNHYLSLYTKFHRLLEQDHLK